MIDATPSTYQRLIARLQPGDTLQLAPGTYAQSLILAHLHGTPAQPIVIRGTGASTLLRAQPCCNTVQLRDTDYLEVRDLTLDGGNLDGPFAVDARGACSHITLENLRIVHYGADQQDVAISTKGPAWDWIIRGNTIVGAGTGMYLGNSDGTSPFVAGLIEHNLILDTRGYNIEIKHQNARPAGIGLPAGATRTVIRYNVFSKAHQASSGHDARPNLLVGHWPLAGAGAQDLYDIYGNFFYENPTEALFQGEGNISLHDNVFVNTDGAAIAIQAQNARPRDVDVIHNTVLARDGGIRVSGGERGFTERIAGNAVFAAQPISGPGQSNNLAEPYSAAGQWLAAPFAMLGELDLHPKPQRSSALASPPEAVSSPEASTPARTAAGTAEPTLQGEPDFDGCTRVSRRVGAYDRPAGPGSWKLALEVRPYTQREVRHVCATSGPSSLDSPGQGGTAATAR